MKHFFFLILFLFPFSVHALDVPARPADYISDKAGLLSPEIKSQLSNRLRQFELETSNQVVVAIFPSLEDNSLEDFSIRLAQTWKLGQKGVDNGLIFLIFPNDKKMRIEVGYGLEDRMTDANSHAIISKIVAPYFREASYNEGVTAGVEAIIKQLMSVPGSNTKVQDQNNNELTEEDIRILKETVVPFILIIIIIVFFIDLFRYAKYKKTKKNIGATGYSFGEWWFRFAILLFIISLLFRILIYSLLSSGNGQSRRSGPSGGGGRFGGGGASGGW